MKARKISLDQIRDAARIQRDLIDELVADEGSSYYGEGGAEALEADRELLRTLEGNLKLFQEKERKPIDK